MDKRRAKHKLDDAVRRAERQGEEWTDDSRNQAEDTAKLVSHKAGHAWEKMKDASRDAKEKVTGRT